MGWFLILHMLASMILGEVGNSYKVIFGGLVVGIVQKLSISIPWLGLEYKLGVFLLIKFFIFLVCSQGIFK